MEKLGLEQVSDLLKGTELGSGSLGIWTQLTWLWSSFFSVLPCCLENIHLKDITKEGKKGMPSDHGEDVSQRPMTKAPREGGQRPQELAFVSCSPLGRGVPCPPRGGHPSLLKLFYRSGYCVVTWVKWDQLTFQHSKCSGLNCVPQKL